MDQLGTLRTSITMARFVHNLCFCVMYTLSSYTSVYICVSTLRALSVLMYTAACLDLLVVFTIADISMAFCRTPTSNIVSEANGRQGDDAIV